MIKIAVALYVTYLVVIFGVYFAVSNRDIQVSAFIQSASTWDQNPNAVRAIFLNAPTGRVFTDGDVELRFDGEIETPEIPSHGHVHTAISPKSDGKKSLAFSFTPPLTSEPFLVQSDVDVRSAAPRRAKFTSRRKENAAKETLVPKWEGALEVHVLPNGAELARGLENTIYLVVTDTEKRPVQATIVFTKIGGIVDEKPTELKTDGVGVARWVLRPSTTLRLEVEVKEKEGERVGSGKLNLFTVPSQFKVTQNNLIVGPDGYVEGAVETLHRSGALFVDVYDAGTWRVADAFGIRKTGTGFRVQLPGVSSSYVRTQVYQELFSVGDGWDVTHYAVGDPHDCSAALYKTLSVVAASGGLFSKWASALQTSSIVGSNSSSTRCRKWLHAALLAIPAEFTEVPVLVNSQKRDREKLEAWRSEVKADLKIATGVALVAGLLVVFLLVLQGLARSREQERLFREVDAELEEGDVLQVGGTERYLVLMRVAVVMVTLSMFVAAMMMLLNFL